MERRDRKDSTNTVVMVLMLVGAIVLGYYATVALTSRDLLWFLTTFEDQPSRFVIYHGRQPTELKPGDAGFDELAGAVQTSLEGGFARLTNVGYSQQTLDDAYSQSTTLEVFWTRPVELHAWFPTGRTTQMLFPITGRHAEMDIVLLGDQGHYRVGAPALNDVEPVREALRSLGYD